MSIRKRILIPMIALTAIGCIAVLVSSMFLFRRELNDSMHNKVDVAVMVAINEIDELKSKAQIAAFGMASNPELIDAIKDGDREGILRITNALRTMAGVDYCTILDTSGIVLTRTHAPTQYGDSLNHLPHVLQALNGNSESYVAQGVTIRLGTYAGAPIYDNNHNMIGVVSLGFRLDDQAFVYKLKEITGCDITVFLYDERVSTTLFDEEGLYAIGTRAPRHISDRVLAGEAYTGLMQLFGNNVLTRYIPLYGDGNYIVGMLFVGYDTSDDDSKMVVFIISGALIMMIVLLVCVALAMFISGIVENQLEKMMQQVDNAQVTTSSMFASSPQSNILFDKDFKIIDCNPAALKLMGFETKSQMLAGFAQRLNDGIPEVQPDGRPSQPMTYWAQKAVEEGFVRFETQLTLLGNKVTLRVEFRKIPYEGDYAVVAYVYDLTEIREREMELIEVHELNELQLTKLDLMVKATKIGLWDMEVIQDDPVNPNNKFMWSDDLRHMLGYRDERDFPNLLSSWSDLLHPEDKGRTLEAFAKHLLDVTGNTPYYIEYRLLKKNGEYSYYRASGETIRDEEGKPIRVAGALTDITESVELQATLRQARDSAEAANRSKSAFLANMSHEIRTPMNSIIGFSELAQDEDAIPPRTRQYLINISDNAKWLLNILNDILDNTKIESGKITLENIPFDIQDVIAQCQSAVLPKTVEKGFSLYCYSEPLIGKKIIGDPVRLRQILMNLLSNAVKFTTTGTVKLLTSIREVEDKSAIINFEIKDSGIGMSAEQIAQIFEPYMQADDSVTRRFGGTGLGLPISKNLVEMMGGQLAVESIPGVGSTFRFTLSFNTIDDTAVPATSEVVFNTVEKPSFNGEILICEDNHLNQQVICDHLARVGVTTVVAQNGKDGLDLVELRMQCDAKPFDLIFMDIHMPIMDGLEAAEKITELGVKTPIVALTANIMSNDLELYKNSGMHDYLGKPFTSQDLWKCLMKYLPIANIVTVDRQKQTAEEDKSLVKLREYFFQSNQNTFEKIMNALDTGDIKLAHRLIHTLKSNAGQIGEKRLQEIAAVSETMLADGENLLSSEQGEALELELKAVLERLTPLVLRGGGESKDAPALSPKRAMEIITKLEPMLKGYNAECMNMLDDIRLLPESEALAGYVENFEFRQALDELTKVKALLK